MTNDTGNPIVVVGAGVVGWMVAWQLGLLGARVRIVDRCPDHTGLHAGPETCLVRHDQRDPISARLAMLSEQWWRTLEQRSLEHRWSRALVSTTGCIDIGRADSAALHEVTNRIQSLRLDHEVLEAGELMRRYPALRTPRDTAAIVQSGIISIHAANAIAALRSEGRALSIDSSFGAELVRWRPGSCDLVRGDGGVETCRYSRLVICTGAGLRRDAPSLRDSEVRRYESVRVAVSPDLHTSSMPPLVLHTDAPGRSVMVVRSGSTGTLTICDANGDAAGPAPHQLARPLAGPYGAIDAHYRHVAEEADLELTAGVTGLMPGLSPLTVTGCSCSELCASTTKSFALQWLEDDQRALAVGGFGTAGYALSPAVARAVAELLVDSRTEIELPTGLPVRRG